MKNVYKHTQQGFLNDSKKYKETFNPNNDIKSKENQQNKKIDCMHFYDQEGYVKGEIKDFSPETGKGKIYFKDQYIYIGDMINGKMEGKRRIIFL